MNPGLQRNGSDFLGFPEGRASTICGESCRHRPLEILESFIPASGCIVTNTGCPAERAVAFYNKRGRCEQWVKEGKGAIKWTRLSCRTFATNAVRFQLYALAYNLGGGDAQTD